MSRCVVVLAAVLAATSHAGEREISTAWCSVRGGQSEYRYMDGTRVDCRTPTHAVEVEWAHKWKDAIGQSLWYAAHDVRRAGVVLILRSPSDTRYVDQIARTVAHYGLPIDVWITDGEQP